MLEENPISPQANPTIVVCAICYTKYVSSDKNCAGPCPKCSLKRKWPAYFIALASIIIASFHAAQETRGNANPFVLVTLFAFVSHVSEMIFKPFAHQTAQHLKTQYYLADMYVLIAQLTLVASPIYKSSGLEMAIPIALLIVSWWWLGLKMLSRNGVSQSELRLFALAITVPLGFGIPPILVSIVVYRWSSLTTALFHNTPPYVLPWNYVLFMLISGIWCSALFASIKGSRDSFRSAIASEVKSQELQGSEIQPLRQGDGLKEAVPAPSAAIPVENRNKVQP